MQRHHLGEVNGTRTFGSRKTRVLFICGTIHTSKQMHQIARELSEFEPAFTPYWGDTPTLRALRAMGALETTILGERAWRRCMAYLEENRLPIDEEGRECDYDFVVTTH